MKTVFTWICPDWIRVKNHCRTTVNKNPSNTEPSEEFKKRLLISEHSPIRTIRVAWSWAQIKSWVATHWSRHKFEKYISTQRDDRTNSAISRDNLPQGALVNFDGDANMQSLIDVWRKRLCYQASPETRALAEDFKVALHERYPELADVLVPNCVYRCGCPEFNSCEWFNNYFIKTVEEYGLVTWGENSCPNELFNLFDIQERYKYYNETFYATHKYREEDAHADSGVHVLSDARCDRGEREGR